MIDKAGGLVVLLASATATIACETGDTRAAYVIPGPTGPTPVSTLDPFLWDTREELAVWTGSPVSRGPIAIVGQGRDAVIRIESGATAFSLENGARVQWALRGPDFEAPVTDIRAARIRYTWMPAIRNASVPVAMPDINAVFDVPGYGPGPDQLTLRSDIVREQSGVMLLQDQYVVPFEARYFYLYSDGGNRGVLEIDSIGLVRDEPHR